jgi:hypothetical protein
MAVSTVLVVIATVMCTGTRQISTITAVTVKIPFILRTTRIVSRHWSVTCVSSTRSRALNLRLLYNSTGCSFLFVPGHGMYFGMFRRMQAFRYKVAVIKNKMNETFCTSYEPCY